VSRNKLKVMTPRKSNLDVTSDVGKTGPEEAKGNLITIKTTALEIYSYHNKLSKHF